MTEKEPGLIEKFNAFAEIRARQVYDNLPLSITR